jgi:8-oxo-dGTP pyrophosphatase MutT (NUDIX family)
MPILDRITRAAKAFAGPGPAAMTQAAEDVSQMEMNNPFAPGLPIGPYDGYSRTPRTQDFQTGYNIATRPRTHERISFETLRGLVEAYDVAQMCIWHRIDSIRSLDWKLVAADHYDGDVADAVLVGLAALAKPDRQNSFETWLAKWLYDVLAYDAGALSRMRNRGGAVVGLQPVDGTTLAPLLDYWGNSPAEPAEAYVQYVNGLPWNWLTRGDLIYEPFRPRNNSPYGQAPLETVMINANTDIRFQVYFLQRFTEGNVPEAFASAPESWSPDQVEQFQEYWDSFMYGDQSRKNQIRWIPGGSSFAWSNEKEFTDTFSLFLMRKTAAAYHVVPADLGFTENVNKSSGESQADVQHRVGDLPLMRYIQRVISSFLQDDLGLPLKHAFDLGEEQVDQAAQAQADKIYVDMGSVGPSEIREMRYGKPEPGGIPVPRYISTSRGGPVPLAALFALAGQIDPASGAPLPGAQLPQTVFTPAEGVLAAPPAVGVPLAEQEFGPGAMPIGPAPQPMAQPPAAPVAKDGEGGGIPTAGITAETGITGYDLVGQHDDEDQADEPDRAAAVKAELGTFRRFDRARRKAGAWRDFQFAAVDPAHARELNHAGRLGVRKAAGDVGVAGLAVQAADTGRVLMLQRALDEGDPAAGMWEFPGGHMEGDEVPVAAAMREWAEETGCILPFAPESMAALAAGTGPGWVSGNGIYAGFAYQVPSEAAVPVRAGSQVTNPDDPDGDQVEAIAWWDPALLAGNPAVRPELLDSLDGVLAALGCTPAAGCCGAGCCEGGCCGGEAGCSCGPAEIAKAYPAGQDYGSHAFRPSPDGYEIICWFCGLGETDPNHRAYRPGVAKAATASRHWPGWALDHRTARHWAPLIGAGVAAAFPRRRLAELAGAYLAAHPGQQGSAPGKRDRNDTAAAWLREQGADVSVSTDHARGVITDAYLSGVASAAAVVAGGAADTGGWAPGNSEAARQRVEQLGEAATLGMLVTEHGSDVAAQISAGYLNALARVLAAADGDTDPGDLGDLLGDAIGDGDLSVTLVGTVICIYTGQAAQDYYCGAGAVTMGQWLCQANSCPVCLSNEEAGQVRIGEAYPSGDSQPPAHPNCGCAVVPAYLPPAVSQ